MGLGANIDDTSTLEVGYSTKGMKELDASLKEMLVKDINAALDQLQNGVEDALKKCWQGKSRDDFFTDFEKRIKDTQKEIAAEYTDLQSRFSDVAKYFKNQDDELYDRAL